MSAAICMLKKRATKKILLTALYTMCAGRSKAKFKPYTLAKYYNLIAIVSAHTSHDRIIEFTHRVS